MSDSFQKIRAILMQDTLPIILQIQELDIKMIRLMRIKTERKKELEKLHELKKEIKDQMDAKHEQVLSLKTQLRLGETQIKEIQEKVARLEGQQAAVKKMDEFNALTHEITRSGKEKAVIEQNLSDLMDKLATEEDLFETLKKNLDSTKKNSDNFATEVQSAIEKINTEGSSLLTQRTNLITKVPEHLFNIYERLLKNKRDRVVVPIENRVCSGCHIVLTAQHENLVRKKDRLVFCEHCSRILYWEETSDQDASTTKRRRRKATVNI